MKKIILETTLLKTLFPLLFFNIPLKKTFQLKEIINENNESVISIAISYDDKIYISKTIPKKIILENELENTNFFIIIEEMYIKTIMNIINFFDKITLVKDDDNSILISVDNKETSIGVYVMNEYDSAMYPPLEKENYNITLESHIFLNNLIISDTSEDIKLYIENKCLYISNMSENVITCIFADDTIEEKSDCIVIPNDILRYIVDILKFIGNFTLNISQLNHLKLWIYRNTSFIFSFQNITYYFIHS